MKTIGKIIGWTVAIPALVLLIVAGVSSFGTTSASAPDEGIRLDVSAVPEAHHAAAARAVEQLFAACPGLGQHRNDIAWIKAYTDGTRDVWVESEYGWKHWVSFEAKVADDARTPKEWRAWGHHLFYAVGPTGVEVSKDTAGYFCGLGHRSGFIALN